MHCQKNTNAQTPLKNSSEANAITMAPFLRACLRGWESSAPGLWHFTRSTHFVPSLPAPSGLGLEEIVLLSSLVCKNPTKTWYVMTAVLLFQKDSKSMLSQFFGSAIFKFPWSFFLVNSWLGLSKCWITVSMLKLTASCKRLRSARFGTTTALGNLPGSAGRRHLWSVEVGPCLDRRGGPCLDTQKTGDGTQRPFTEVATCPLPNWL